MAVLIVRLKFSWLKNQVNPRDFCGHSQDGYFWLEMMADLAPLCSNCHRMIHPGTPWLAVEQMRGESTETESFDRANTERRIANATFACIISFDEDSRECPRLS